MNIVNQPALTTQKICFLLLLFFLVHIECNCYSDGVVDNGVCQRSINASTPIGQCNCKTNVKGRTCDQCKDGYFSLMSSNMHGCQGKL